MTREKQLTFCKRCTFRKLDIKQGLICNLRGQKADFKNECPDFEVDNKVLIDEKKKKEAIKPNKKRAEIAQTLIWIVMIFDIISIISSYFQYNLLKSLERNEFVSDEMLNSNDLREQIIGILYLIVFTISAVTFIQWFRRAYYNLNIRTNCSHSENWAVISWFIPIISLFRPYQIMKEMWTETSNILKSKSENCNVNSTIIIGLWWTLWIISNYIGQYILKSAFKAQTIENFVNITVGDISMSILGIPLAILTVFMIKYYSLKEEKLIKIENKTENDLPKMHHQNSCI